MSLGVVSIARLMPHNILIASYLEPELVARIDGASKDVEVHFHPQLIAPPRFAADHIGAPFQRSAEQERKWKALLQHAEILFDFDRTHMRDLPDLAPNLKWIQTTSSGVGQTVREFNYAERFAELVITTARGVHAQPLAEFCLMIMLAFYKSWNLMQEQQQRKEWARFSGTDLCGRTVTILGLGRIGTEIAKVCRTLRMNVIGIKRDVADIPPATVHVAQLLSEDKLEAVLGETDVLIVAAPHTPDTEKMIGRRQLQQLKRGAILINIGRGPVVDEAALIEALQSGHLLGAGLDVFEEEPLPVTSPLWTMPNVFVSPHSGSTSDRENGRITELFCRNLECYLRGEPMENRLDMDRLY